MRTRHKLRDSDVILMTLQMTLTYVEESFEVMFVPGEDLQQVN